VLPASDVVALAVFDVVVLGLAGMASRGDGVDEC
jgi:hypothetical protein